MCRTQGMARNFGGFMGECGGEMVWASFPNIRKMRAANLYSWNASQLQPRHPSPERRTGQWPRTPPFAVLGIAIPVKIGWEL